MLTFNTMRFGTDELIFNKQALLIAKTPFDAGGQTFVEGFVIEGAEPTGSMRRIIFKVDDSLYKFVNGVPTAFDGDADIDNVLTNGNTVAEIGAVDDIPDWVGKKIFPIVALHSPADATVMPSIKMSLKVRSATDVYEKTTETAEIDLTANDTAIPRIVDIEATTQTTGRGVANITARVKKDGNWSDWTAIQAVKDMDATAIQFKIRYTVGVIGGADSARVEKIQVRHTFGTAIVSGDNAEIYSVQQNYEHTLQTCAVTVRHKRLIDSVIGAYVSFSRPMKKRVFLPIGISSGAAQVLTLGENNSRDAGIDQSSLQLFADGNPIVNFSYNTEVSEVTINVAAGKAITATYNYDRDVEVWREMSVDVNQQPFDDGTYLTRFTYTLPDEELNGQTVTNIRLQLFRTSGRATDEYLGIANGLTQQFVLAHAAKGETLMVNAQFSYDEDSQIVTLIAPHGTELRASYDWIGESHTVYSWAAAWSPAV